MTAAERLRREGRKEGYKENGREYLIAMLQGRFGALPEAVLAVIRAAEKTQLDRWFQRGIMARSLDDVFGDAA
jgi:hypothetical protein